MTLEEYAHDVGTSLRNAHNRKDMAAVQAAFRQADEKLTRIGTSEAAKTIFWASVRKAAFSGQWLVEKQANSALIELMKAIEQGLKARGG
jgi:hypothetical protein